LEQPTPDTAKGMLISHIFVMRSKRFSFTSNSEMKNTGGDFGLEENLGLRSKNTFRNAEVFSINFHGAMEMQTVTNTPSTSNFPFNVFEAGVNTSLTFPRFVTPFRKRSSARYLRPKTRITVGYNYQKRPDYTRYILNGSIGYSWQPINKRIFNFKLLDVSSVKIYPTTEFQEIIDNYTDPRIKYSYQDHIVLSTGYSYNYNEHRFKGLRPFMYLFTSIEIGGAPWNIFARLNPNARDSLGRITIFGIPSAEYLLMEADGRYYLPSGKDLMNVFRANIGIGIPYGSTKAMPFEKSFYIGGANSLRAWVIGTLGPGSFNSKATTFEMTGDIKIELNYEFRFKISGSFEGALFTDIGNIWLLNESDAMPGGQFNFKTFIPQFAVDFGYGLRYDLEFLILRLDFAHPLYQPYLPENSRWTALNAHGKVITGFNFAIGYPF
jgi:outer membrane protein assembly factor BamA